MNSVWPCHAVPCLLFSEARAQVLQHMLQSLIWLARCWSLCIRAGVPACLLLHKGLVQMLALSITLHPLHVSAGHLEIAKWLHSQDPDSWFWACGHACTLAARYGFLHILRWLSTAAPPRPDDIGPCTEAAARGRLAIMKWARSASYAWDESTYVAAAAVSLLTCSSLCPVSRSEGPSRLQIVSTFR